MKKKMIAIIYGNCHVGGIEEILRNVEEFSSKYEINHIPYIQDIDIESFLDSPILYECDLFIHQAIRINNKFGVMYSSENIIKHLKKEARVIAIPNLYGLPRCYFPQCNTDHILRMRIPLEHIQFFYDDIMDIAIKNNNWDGRQYYEDIGLFSSEYLQSEWELFIDRVIKREDEWDVKVKDFIIKHRDERLFYDPNHPTEIIIRYIAKEILVLLDIKVPDNIDNVKIEPLVPYETPLCASVIAFFGMNTKVDDTISERQVKMFMGDFTMKKYCISYYSLVFQNKDFSIRTRFLSACCFFLLSLYFVPVNCFRFVRKKADKLWKLRGYKNE